MKLLSSVHAVLVLFTATLTAGDVLIRRDPATLWRYLDTVEAPDPKWALPEFDDSRWKSGPAPLGYGERGLGSTLSFGSDANNKPVTAWFRCGFTVKDPAAAASLAVQIVCDDGAVIYLNGKEAARANMPGGPVTPRTEALEAIDSDAEGEVRHLALSPESKLRPGANVLAVEVHQAYPRSSDLFLALELTAYAPGEAPKILTAAERRIAAAGAAWEKNPADMEAAYEWVRAHVETRTGLTEKVSPRPLPKEVPAEWKYIVDGPKWPDKSPVLTKAAALGDLDYLEEMIANCYAYADRRGADWRAALDTLRASITGDIRLGTFQWRLERFLNVFGDPHSRFRGNPAEPGRQMNAILVPHGDKILAVKPDRSGFLAGDAPVLAAIDGVPVTRWLAAARDAIPKASPQYQRRAEAERLAGAESLAWELGLKPGREMTLSLTSLDGGKSAEAKVALRRSLRSPVWPAGTTRMLEGGIGYLRIPEMESGPRFTGALDAAMAGFRDTKALIIDVRNNGGGTQDAIRTLLPYFMAPDAPMKIVNAAAYRLPLPLPRPSPSGFLGLNGRGLHPLSSSVWDASQKQAIEDFLRTWKPQWLLPAGKFSDWHFMGIRHSDNPAAYHYRHPLIVLLDEGCFSATDNFLGALKGHPNVTLLGTASGGGSGRMASYQLPNAQLTFTLCQMASFATTGKTYDGNGVEPDIVLPPVPEDSLTTGKDTQLQEAVRLAARP